MAVQYHGMDVFLPCQSDSCLGAIGVGSPFRGLRYCWELGEASYALHRKQYDHCDQILDRLLREKTARRGPIAAVSPDENIRQAKAIIRDIVLSMTAAAYRAGTRPSARPTWGSWAALPADCRVRADSPVAASTHDEGRRARRPTDNDHRTQPGGYPVRRDIADSVSVNRRHSGTRRRGQNAQFWLTPSARRALIAADPDIYFWGGNA